MSPFMIAADGGYKISKNKVADDIYYRPSHNGAFISKPLKCLDEAKAVCERHYQENQKEYP